MAVSKRGGQLQINYFKGTGGKTFDTRHLSTFYNFDAPYMFDRMVSGAWSRMDRFRTKVLTGMTMAKGNYHEIPADTYTWVLLGDDERRLRIMDYVIPAANTTPGLGKEIFQVVVDEGWHEQPDVLMLDDPAYLVRVIGKPRPYGLYYKYDLQLLTGDNTKFIPPTLLQPGREINKVSTNVADEMNPDYGTGTVGSQTKLQSQIGNYAEEFKVTDKVIRHEIRARKRGAGTYNYGKSYSPMKGSAKVSASDALSGFTFAMTKTNKKTKKSKVINIFTSWAEGDLNERINLGREVMMVYGEADTTTDDKGYIKRTGAGLRQLVRDGWEFYHGGTLTAAGLENWLRGIFLTRLDEGSRHIIFDTGELGAILFHQLLSEEYASFLTLDTNFIRAYGDTGYGLEYGAQFRSFQALNGIKVTLKMNPMKDDRKFDRRPYPLNAKFTIDSARMDVYDFGMSTSSEAKSGTNMAMIVQDGVESYFWTSGAVDPKTGIMKSGEKVATADKGVSCKREASGSLQVWDTSRLGAIIYDPDYGV